MFSDKEQELFLSNIEKLQSESEDLTNEIVIPTLKDKNDVMNIVIKYIKDNNLVVYGGNAQNLSIKRINPKDCFYEENTINDFDTYSSNPVQDIINVSNIIYKAGYKDIRAQEAIHIDTYTLKFGELNLCDFTYMPKYILDNINTYVVDGIRIIDPYFAYIDFMRMFSDPLFNSSRRWDKTFKRLMLMQKYYPIEPKYNKLEFNNNNNINKDIKSIIKSFLKKSDTSISIGQDVYNKYVKLILKPEDKIPLNSYTIITSNYLVDTQYIYQLLKKKYKDKITKKEKYPFFQFWDTSCEIYLDNLPIVKIYRNNNICIQYKTYKNIKYASFTTNLMWLMIENIYYKMYNKDCSASPNNNQKQIINDIYIKLLQNMLYMKDLYLTKNKKTFLDDTLFQHFVLKCSGVPISENELRKNIKNYKGFKYIPNNGIIENLQKVYNNISGRFISSNNELINEIIDV